MLLHEVSKATSRQPYTLKAYPSRCSLLIGKSGILHIGDSHNQLKHVLAPDVVLLAPAQARRNYSIATPHGPVCFYEIVLGEGIATSYFKFLHQDFGLCLHLSSEANSRRILRDLAGWKQFDEVDRSRRLFRLLLQLHQEGKRQRNNLQQILGGNRELLKTTAQEYRFSVQTMALTLGCSTAYMDKHFRERYGQSCGSVLRALRLEIACDLLRENALTLDEIAYECGYANATSLSTALKRATGKPLAALRRSKSCSSDDWVTPLSRSASTESKRRKPSPTLAPVEPYFHFVGDIYRDRHPYVHDLSISNYPPVHNWVFTLAGRAKLLLDGKSYELTPGRVSVEPIPCKAVVKTVPGVAWHRIAIRTFGPFAFDAFRELTRDRLFFLEIDPDCRPVQLAKKWCSNWSKRRNQPSAIGSRQAYEWLLEWYGVIQRGEYRELPIPNLYEHMCSRINRDVSTVKDYAASFGLSRPYFTRALMKIWGNPPARIMREQRLAQAAQKLQYSRLPVDEIAEAANYAHTASFIKAFKGVYGMTPLQYRYQ